MATKSWEPILDRAAQIVSEYSTPVTLRQLHYRLVAEALDTASGYRNVQADYKNLSRLTAAARREGSFPRLLDQTRSISQAQTFDGPQEAIEQAARWYRRDLLEGQEVLPGGDGREGHAGGAGGGLVRPLVHPCDCPSRLCLQESA